MRLLLACILFPLLAAAQPCTISNEERAALLKLSYKSFDQSLPNGGWRKYQECEALTRNLIDAYTALHARTLKRQEWNTLVWHSAQLSALAGDSSNAIDKMEQTLDPNELPTAAFRWNSYVNASIAFLKKDRPSLLAERKNLARGSSPYNHINLRVVDSFLRCFGTTYKDAYSKTCKPVETNSGRIRSLAVAFDRVKPFAAEFFGLADFFAMKKVILVGEVHGTKTVPEFFVNLVAAVAKPNLKTLAVLEIPQESQTSIDAFLKLGDENLLKKDLFFTRPFQDGRSSQAMVALLKQLAKLPNTSVLCMDSNAPQSGQERDTAMANFINSKRVGYDHTLVLSGNVHSAIVPGTSWDRGYRPLGYELKSMAKDLKGDDLLAILARFEKVDAWNCQGTTEADCGAHYGIRIPSDYSEAVPFPSYFLWENEITDGHNATVFFRSAKLSPPFR